MISNLKSKLKAISSSSHLHKNTADCEPNNSSHSTTGQIVDYDKSSESACSSSSNGCSASGESSDNLESSGSISEPVTESAIGTDNNRGDFGGIVVSSELGEFVLKRTVYSPDSSYGNTCLSDLFSASFENSKLWAKTDSDISLEDIVFLDTETTGLAGGTGTMAFLVGLGYAADDGFVVEQYVARDFDEEKPMLAAVLGVLKQYKILVTFNGKSFDWPLVESRCIYSRLRPLDWEDSHLDLLHTARRLWSMRLKNCSLSSLEENILHRFREDDIPGSLIPNIYLDYLNTRSEVEMKRVIQHNEWDIAAMSVLLVRINDLYLNPIERCDPFELLSIGKEFEREQRINDAACCYRACINAIENVDRGKYTANKAEVTGSGKINIECAHMLYKGIDNSEYICSTDILLTESKKRLAYLLKRYEGPGEAVGLWLDLAGMEGSLLIFPLVEMAKYMEHKQKDFQSALEYTEQALNIINISITNKNTTNKNIDRKSIDSKSIDSKSISASISANKIEKMREELLNRRQRLMRKLRKEYA